MEQVITHIIDNRMVNGLRVNVVRNHILCSPKRDYCKETHKEFTRDQKKEAKANHKLYLASIKSN